eukprot:MONOS_2207.1-p1 / transcript=MONOS_2207.1 / gene=MONOS_2207 / organism=Monocercomonoides_exilis_PA203 / gene_product=unspecified product / transcript_product=unspecified product / location=Mono_scaffold00044:15062-22342(+) / protein_length=2427 / sequence_SO=supercontig / SO=protein_coding / is_pseudo=false
MYIPFLEFSISTFDCYSNNGGYITRAGHIDCFKSNALQISSFICAVITLIMLVMMVLAYHIFIFKHNPKNGGLFSCSSGSFSGLEVILQCVLVFVMRMLHGWYFWRGFITVAISIYLILCALDDQPFYSYMSNALIVVRYSMFGGMRLWNELAHLLERIMKEQNAINPGYVFPFVFFAGIVISIGTTIFLCWLLRFKKKKMWLLSKDGHPLVDVSQIDPPLKSNLSSPRAIVLPQYGQSAGPSPSFSPVNLNSSSSSSLSSSLSSSSLLPQTLPKLKHAHQVEPSLRFLQERSFRTPQMMLYADYVYQQGLHRHRSSPRLHFDYACFLFYFMKNPMKSSVTFRQLRLLSPPFAMKFILTCKEKEAGRGNNEGGSSGSGTELTSIIFKSILTHSEELHEEAKVTLREFWENMTLQHPNFSVIPSQLTRIVDSEEQARQGFEELLRAQPHNVQILRMYGQLLLDIYHEEDTAEIIFAQADQLEEDSATSTQIGMMTASMTLPLLVDSSLAQSTTPFQITQAGTQGGMHVNAGAIQPGSEGRHPELVSSPSMPVNQMAAMISGGVAQKEGERKERERRRGMKKKAKKKKKNTLSSQFSDFVVSGKALNRTHDIFITAMIAIVYLVYVIVLVTFLSVFVHDTDKYIVSLHNLRSMCTICSSTALFAVDSMQMLVHDRDYDWQRNEDPTLTIDTLSELQRSMRSKAEDTALKIQSTYSNTKNTDVWEEVSIPFYIISFNETTNKIIKMIEQSQSLLSSIAYLTQNVRLLGTVAEPKSEVRQFGEHLITIIFNSLVPVIDAEKLAMKKYADDTNKIFNTALSTVICAVMGISLVCALLLTILFVNMVRKITKARYMAMIQLVETPKMKMQTIIRFLVQNDRELDEESDSKSGGDETAQMMTLGSDGMLSGGGSVGSDSGTGGGNDSTDGSKQHHSDSLSHSHVPFSVSFSGQQQMQTFTEVQGRTESMLSASNATLQAQTVQNRITSTNSKEESRRKRQDSMDEGSLPPRSIPNTRRKEGLNQRINEGMRKRSGSYTDSESGNRVEGEGEDEESSDASKIKRPNAIEYKTHLNDELTAPANNQRHRADNFRDSHLLHASSAIHRAHSEDEGPASFHRGAEHSLSTKDLHSSALSHNQGQFRPLRKIFSLTQSTVRSGADGGNKGGEAIYARNTGSNNMKIAQAESENLKNYEALNRKREAEERMRMQNKTADLRESERQSDRIVTSSLSQSSSIQQQTSHSSKGYLSHSSIEESDQDTHTPHSSTGAGEHYSESGDEEDETGEDHNEGRDSRANESNNEYDERGTEDDYDEEDKNKLESSSEQQHSFSEEGKEEKETENDVYDSSDAQDAESANYESQQNEEEEPQYISVSDLPDFSDDKQNKGKGASRTVTETDIEEEDVEKEEDGNEDSEAGNASDSKSEQESERKNEYSKDNHYDGSKNEDMDDYESNNECGDSAMQKSSNTIDSDSNHDNNRKHPFYRSETTPQYDTVLSVIPSGISEGGSGMTTGSRGGSPHNTHQTDGGGNTGNEAGSHQHPLSRLDSSGDDSVMMGPGALPHQTQRPWTADPTSSHSPVPNETSEESKHTQKSQKTKEKKSSHKEERKRRQKVDSASSQGNTPNTSKATPTHPHSESLHSSHADASQTDRLSAKSPSPTLTLILQQQQIQQLQLQLQQQQQLQQIQQLQMQEAALGFGMIPQMSPPLMTSPINPALGASMSGSPHWSPPASNFMPSPIPPLQSISPTPSSIISSAANSSSSRPLLSPIQQNNGKIDKRRSKKRSKHYHSDVHSTERHHISTENSPHSFEGSLHSHQNMSAYVPSASPMFGSPATSGFPMIPMQYPNTSFNPPQVQAPQMTMQTVSEKIEEESAKTSTAMNENLHHLSSAKSTDPLINPSEPVYLGRHEDEDEEDEDAHKSDLIRNAFDDHKWEEKLNAEIEKLAVFYKEFPSPFTRAMRVKFIISALLFIVLGSVVLIVALVIATSHDAYPDTLMISGMRSAVLSTIRYFFIRMVHIYAADISAIENVNFTRSTNPVWRNETHVTSDREMLKQLMADSSDYFQTLVMAVHYGESADSKSGDSLFDTVSTHHASTQMNADTLLRTGSCFLEDSTRCSTEPVSERIFGIEGDYFGVESLLARMRLYIDYIQFYDMNEFPLPIDANCSYFKFINSALKNDLTQGNDVITDILYEQGVDFVKNFNNTLTIVIVIFAVFSFGWFLFIVIPLRGSAMKLHRNTDRLKDLLPTTNEEKEMKLMPAMQTGLVKWDTNHEKIMEAAQTVVQSIKEGESISIIMQAHQSLLHLCKNIFDSEENDMLEAEILSDDELEAHKREHLLIRQRLSVLYEQMQSWNDAILMASKRSLVRIFDKHFTVDDQMFTRYQNVAEDSVNDEEHFDENLSSMIVGDIRGMKADNSEVEQSAEGRAMEGNSDESGKD